MDIYGLRNFMRRNKTSFYRLTGENTGVIQKGRFEAFLGSIMIVPVEILKGIEVRLGTLILFSKKDWDVTSNLWDQVGYSAEHDIQYILLPNLVAHRIEESEEDATKRVKQLILKKMRPKNPFPDWEKEHWESGGLYQPATSKALHANFGGNSDGLAS